MYTFPIRTLFKYYTRSKRDPSHTGRTAAESIEFDKQSDANVERSDMSELEDSKKHVHDLVPETGTEDESDKNGNSYDEREFAV